MAAPAFAIVAVSLSTFAVGLCLGFLAGGLWRAHCHRLKNLEKAEADHG